MNIEKSFERDRMEIEKIKEELLKLNLDCTTPSVKRIWDSFTLVDIFRIKKMYEPIISVYHNQNTVVIEYWDVGKEKYSHIIETPDCHISDDMLDYYFGGLSLFLSLIRPDAILLNNFHFGICFSWNEEENDFDYYYDEDEYIENLEYEAVSFIATEILMKH